MKYNTAPKRYATKPKASTYQGKSNVVSIKKQKPISQILQTKQNNGESDCTSTWGLSGGSSFNAFILNTHVEINHKSKNTRDSK